MAPKLHGNRLPFAFLDIARDEGVQKKRTQVDSNQTYHGSGGGASIQCGANDLETKAAAKIVIGAEFILFT